MAWEHWQSEAELGASWPAVEHYLDRAIHAVAPKHVQAEGMVHAMLCRGGTGTPFVVQREASIAFLNQATRDEICDALAAPIYDAIGSSAKRDPWWPGVRDHGVLPRLGTELDVLAVGAPDRLLAIEAKPAGALKGLVWGPAQARFYGELFATLLDSVPGSLEIINEMCQQRIVLGLTPADAATLAGSVQVVPVLAIGPGEVSSVARSRMDQVALALDAFPRGVGVAPLEVWLLDKNGKINDRWQ